jgi:CBS domain-containing protein/anti-sigma regulatory factor (Ser/Thr protein kinase)
MNRSDEVNKWPPGRLTVPGGLKTIRHNLGLKPKCELADAHQSMEPVIANLTPSEAHVTVGEPPKISVAQVLVYELRVRDAMSAPVVSATPGDSLRTIQHLLKAHRISGVPIVDDGILVGLVSLEDIINALDKSRINDSAEAWMTRGIQTLRDHQSLVRAVGEFDRYGFGRFPVLNSAGQLVGIITQGDITSCLMRHLEKRAEQATAREAILRAGQAADFKGSRVVVVRAHIKAGDFDNAGKISQKMRQILRAKGIEPDIRRRAAIVAYEAETNVIIHSIGGDLKATISNEKVEIEAVDQGPGIENVSLAMQEGWSTAGPLARELGFGAGMGLPNMKKCSDKFEVQSEMGVGTRLRSEIALRKAVLQPAVQDTKTNES